VAISEHTDDIAPSAIRLGRPPIGAVNWLGLWTLCAKEVRRFMKIPAQTILAPTMTTLVFLAIFALALGGAVRTVDGVPFMVFLAPGLVMMSIVQNAFANTSSSMMSSKIQGNLVDVLIPPLSPTELTLAFAVGGVTRGLMVGLTVGVAISTFVPIGIHSLWALIFYPAAASLMLSLMGMAAAIWADKFDQMAAITNFVITPLAFLSGTFYSIDRLPEPWHTVSLFNPFFYMIDGMRYALIGQAAGSIVVGVVVLLAINAALWTLCHQMLARGYKIKQ
jgi:ABC-2 type transport system permease protein